MIFLPWNMRDYDLLDLQGPSRWVGLMNGRKSRVRNEDLLIDGQYVGIGSSDPRDLQKNCWDENGVQSFKKKKLSCWKTLSAFSWLEGSKKFSKFPTFLRLLRPKRYIKYSDSDLVVPKSHFIFYCNVSFAFTLSSKKANVP